MKKQKLLSIILATLFTISGLTPLMAQAYAKHTSYNTDQCIIWYQWRSQPFSVDFGDKQPGEEYAITEKAPKSVVEASLNQLGKSFDRSCFVPANRDHPEGYFENDLDNCGLMGLPYRKSETNYQKPVWGVCTDLVKIYLRDYVGYDLNTQDYGGTSSGYRFMWDDDTLFNKFANARSLPGYLCQHTEGVHQAYLLPTQDDSGETWGYLKPYYDGGSQNQQAFRNYLIQEEAAGRLHKGAIMAWASQFSDMYQWDEEQGKWIMVNNERITHLAVYAGGGYVYQSTPNGMAKDEAKQTPSSGKGGFCKYYFNIDKPDFGKIKLIKKSTDETITKNNSCYDLDGCQFKITNKNDSSITEILTIHKDSDGNYSATSGNLKAGEYKIEEIKSGKGFKLNTSSSTVTVVAGKTNTYSYKPTSSSQIQLGILGNQPLNDPLTLSIKKVNSKGAEVPLGDAKLKGALFKVTYYDAILDEATVEYDNTTYTVNSVAYDCKKIHGQTAKKTWILESDENGIVDFENEWKIAGDDFYLDAAGNPCVPLGTITIEEIKAPYGFVKDGKPRLFVIKDENGVVSGDYPSQYTLPNTPREGQIEIEKFEIDFEDGRLPEEEAYLAAIHEEGAKFEVRLKSSNKLYDTLVTNSDGYAISKRLPVGLYTVKQIEGREGTKFVNFDVDISFSEEDVANGTEYKLYSYKFPDNAIYNEYLYGKIKVIKIDADTREVITKAGVTFKVRPTEDIVVCGVTKYPKDEFITIDGISQFATNSDGIIEMPGLPYGHYELIETKTVSPYIKRDDPFPVTINAASINSDGYVLTEIENHQARGQINLIKTGDMLVGVNEEEISTDLVIEEGLVAKHPVIEKQILAGVKFELLVAEKLVDKGVTREVGYSYGIKTTDSEGKLSFKDLPVGKYNIVEREVPAGYVLDETPKPVEIKYNGQNQSLIIKNVEADNVLRTVNVSLEKYEEEMSITVGEGEEVYFTYETGLASGFVFALYNKNDLPIQNTVGGEVIPAGSILDYCVSDEDGKVSFTGKYPSGEYYVKELAAVGKEKYKLHEEEIPTSNIVNDDTLKILDINLGAITNWYKKTPVVINKTDITGEAGLPGATLEVYDENGTVIYRGITDEAGTLEELTLIPGKYTIHEVYAPEGYALSEDSVEFEIVENEEGELEIVGSTTMKDELTEYKFYKVDETGKKKLFGAEFTMYRVSGEGEDQTLDAVMVAVSDDHGIVTFQGFGFGTYVIKETLAPEDYMLTDEIITLEVDNEWMNDISYTDGGELMTSIKNNKPPVTGNEMSAETKTAITVAIVTGSALALAAAGYIVFRVVKKKRVTAN